MKFSCFLCLSILMLSCQSSVTAKKLKGCDSLVITFNQPGSDSVINVVSTTETNAIQKVAGFLDGQSAESSVCDYNGHMLFFKAGQQVLPVVFKYSSDSCRQFVFDLDNKVMNTKMKNEAVDFLQSLSGGKNWY